MHTAWSVLLVAITTLTLLSLTAVGAFIHFSVTNTHKVSMEMQFCDANSACVRENYAFIEIAGHSRQFACKF